MNINTTQERVEIYLPKARRILIPFSILNNKWAAVQCIATYLIDFCKGNSEFKALDQATAAAMCWVGAREVYEKLEQNPDLAVFLVMMS